jgi:putative flippase GtrA
VSSDGCRSPSGPAFNPKEDLAQEQKIRAVRLAGSVLDTRLTRFLLVGGLSFAIDFGLLVLLHEGLDVELWIATPIAFIVSLLFNFAMQRSFTFQSTEKRHVSAFKYGLLVVFNVVATDLIVVMIDRAGASYGLGKVVATVCTMTWNFLAYKYWIFRRDPSGSR